MNTYINQIWQIWQIRICFRLLLLALGLTITTAAQTPAIPLGGYTAVIPQDVRVGNLTFLSGEYQLTLLVGGRFQLGLNDFIGYSGTYTVSGNQVRFTGPANTDVCGSVFISADNGQTWRSTRGIRAHTVFDFGVFNNVLYGTGLGADATDLDANVNASVQATIGGRTATVQYAGRAPGFVGLNQFNILLPAGLASGTHTLLIARGGSTSNAVTITIK
jgi:hypothetical protein